MQGEYVRLYCTFLNNGLLADPWQPKVFITDNEYYQESSSSSTVSTSSSGESSSTERTAFSSESSEPGQFGPFWAVRETTGIWYVDFFVPNSMATGTHYDMWEFQWSDTEPVQQLCFEFTVHAADSYINWVSPAMAMRIGPRTAALMNDLENCFIFEAQHIPVYWEQGYPRADRRTLNFAYGNWDKNYRVMLRKNQKLLDTGWFADYNGLVRVDQALDPEDFIEAHYYFHYFSQEELLDFLNFGLKMMNSLPPASTYYTSLEGADRTWDAGILLCAAVLALRRLVFGFNFQERAFVLAETGTEQQRKIENFKALYTEYSQLWAETGKNVKTKRLAGMSQIVTPEYTLPGGRSRWFRYLYKQN